MANKLNKLTTDDKNKVLSGTSYVLPNNPTEKGWSADQIRQKGYKGVETLFDLVNNAIDETQQDLNTKADSSTISALNSSVSSNTASINSITSVLDEIGTPSNIAKKSDLNGYAKTTDLSQYAKSSDLTSYATKSYVSNGYVDKTSYQTDKTKLEAIANGKTSTYVLSCKTTMPSDETLMYDSEYYYEDGTRITSQAQLLAKLGSGFELTDFVNGKFDSTSDSVSLYGDMGGFIICYKDFKFIFKKLVYTGTIYINDGDVFLITETNVPDRWFNSGNAYKMETTKVDLTPYVNKTSAETISGVKTFSNGIYLGDALLNKDDGFNSINIAVGKNFSVGGILFPYYNNSYDIGSNGFRWKDLYLSGTAYINKVSFGFATNNENYADYRVNGASVFSTYGYGADTYWTTSIHPSTSGTYSLGSADNKWKNLYLSGSVLLSDKYFKYNSGDNAFEMQEGVRLKVGGDILPFRTQSSYARNIGNEGFYWNKGYINEIKSSGTAQYKKVQCLTQDEYDAITTKDENVLYLIKE